MFDDSGFEQLSTDAIESRLVELECVIAKMRACQTRLLREIDGRQVPLADGCRTLTEWAGSRIDVAPETATLLVRLARAANPSIDEAVEAGEISFDRAVELTRLDTDNPVADGSGYAIPRLRSAIACRRRVTRHDEQEMFSSRYLMLQPNLDHTALRLWGELVGVDSSRFEQILVNRADSIQALPDGRKEPRRARLADALTNIVIDCAIEPDAAPGAEIDRVSSTMVTVFVDATLAAPSNAEIGIHLATGPRVGPNALEAILCDGIVEVTAIAHDGTVLGIGDRSQTIAPRIRRYVHHRDKACTADGCTSRYRLQPHHKTYRSDGADNGPANLTLLCWFHHHVVIHGHGFRVDPASPSGRIRFIRPGPDPPD